MLTYTVKRGRMGGEWLVETIDENGEVYLVSFTGQDAHERAFEYAQWKNCVK